MNKNVIKILSIYASLMAAQRKFEDFNELCSNDPCAEDYISQYARTKFKDNLVDVKDALWALLGTVSGHDLAAIISAMEEDMKEQEEKEADGSDYVEHFDND